MVSRKSEKGFCVNWVEFFGIVLKPVYRKNKVVQLYLNNIKAIGLA